MPFRDQFAPGELELIDRVRERANGKNVNELAAEEWDVLALCDKFIDERHRREALRRRAMQAISDIRGATTKFRNEI